MVRYFCCLALLGVLSPFGSNSIASVQTTGVNLAVDAVDPRIGSEGLGRVFIGPSMPFGMVKPGPDCGCGPNSGWLPMPHAVTGFAQTHVSGTGGGPKYGNILIQPYVGKLDNQPHEALRTSENIQLGFYETFYNESNIHVQLTTAERCSFYRFAYPSGSSPALRVDAGFFLGESPEPDAREAQQFVGSEIEIVSDHEIRGYSRIRGGWNNGRAYTVYFCVVADKPFVQTMTWKGEHSSTTDKQQCDEGLKTGAAVAWRPTSDADTLQLLDNETFILLSQKAFRSLKEQGSFVYNGTHYRKMTETASADDEGGRSAIIVKGEIDEACMWIANDEQLPLILKMRNNPIEIDWTIQF